jgi:6-phosphogluconate dehydrogenase
MLLGMIGLGRIGANMVRRLLHSGHECVVYDSSAANVETLVKEGARGSTSLDGFVALLQQPRAVWIMVPAGAVDSVLGDLTTQLAAGDILIDGGNSYYIDDIRRAKQLECCAWSTSSSGRAEVSLDSTEGTAS